MSAIRTSIRKVMERIPRTILNIAFMSKPKAYRLETTLEQQILDLVINKTVLPDIDLTVGIVLKLDLKDCFVTEYMVNEYTRNIIIKVPYNLTNNKKIVTPLSLTINSRITDGMVGGSNPLLNMAAKTFNHNAGGIGGDVYTNLELISNNTILVHDDVIFTTNGILEIEVGNNKNLSNIKPKSYLKFSELVILAVKTYIYNELNIELGSSGLYYGHSLSKLEDIINGWETSGEDYDIFLKEKMSKILFMNNDVMMSEAISLQTGGNL